MSTSKSQIAVRITPFLLDKLNSYVERSGKSKTDFVIGALAQYLGCKSDMLLSQRVATLEAEVKELQALVKKSYLS
ncbi:MAG: DNA-binding domain-containing protein [Moorea sp. SIO3I7]|nr:DNA-binding domain-containing protein [Moorena sp. SIO3I7]NEO08355.1 DNA-binding domain-containing protein [Moorena sp. SIO3I8]